MCCGRLNGACVDDDLQAEAAANTVKELQTQAASYQKDVGRLRGNMSAAATAVEAARSARASLLEAATLEQVPPAAVAYDVDWYKGVWYTNIHLVVGVM
jgi:hypothetical protein